MRYYLELYIAGLFFGFGFWIAKNSIEFFNNMFRILIIGN